jgi:PAS domain S-box-containing protein
VRLPSHVSLLLSLLRMFLSRHPHSQTAALATGFTLLVGGTGLVATGRLALGSASSAQSELTVVAVSLLGALAAFFVSLPLEARRARPRQLLARAAQELANPHHRALRLPSPEDDALAMLTEEFNDVLLQIGDRLLGDAVQSSGEIIAITDPEGRFSFVNRAFLEAYGFAEDEVLGQRIELVVSPGNPPALVAEVRSETLREGWHGELRSRRKDGSEFPIALRTSPIRDEQGALIGLVGMAHDVTERQEAEQRQRLLEAALGAAVDAVLITDRAGVIEWVNPAFTRLTGYTPEEALGQNPRLLKSGRHDAGFYADLWAALVAGRVWKGEITNRRKDGTLYQEDLSITPVVGASGDIAHYVAIKRDISERQALEAQLGQAQKMEAVGRLAGGVAHDFNNLLGVIQGYGELLLKQIGPSLPGRDKLEQILKASQRAANLTRQLLAFSRRQVLEPRILGLNAVVADSEKLLQRLVAEDVEIVVKAAPDLGRVRADAGQIDQVLMNLAANARDAMPKGGRLVIETANVAWDEPAARGRFAAPPGRYVRLTVTDTGAGMDAETQTHIFEPFFTTKERGKGTGLGLATVYGIVKQSGGYIWVDSQPGCGTTFEILLPRVDDEAEPATRAAPAAALSGNETILLVEDEDSLRELARELLESSGYRVLSAASGPEALAVAASYAAPIRLLLTDVVMPGMSGQELADRLRPARPEMTVIYMSGYTEEAIAQRGKMGRDARLIRKPFSVDDLAQSVRDVLG